MRGALLGLVAGAVLLVSPIVARAGAIKNVILMISDGQGFNTVRATEYYTGSKAVYEGADFARYAMQTSSADNSGGYNPASMASNFNYARSGATDSASASTAMYTGVKNNDGRINWSIDGKLLTTFFETAAKSGKSIGAVSSVMFSHATPAGVYGHNKSRTNHSEMVKEAIYGSNPTVHNGFYDARNYYGNLKVVMGTGHPDYDAGGASQAPNYDYVGGGTGWNDLGTGVNGWTRIESKEDFEKVADGTLNPDKLFGVARNSSTLQQGRSGDGKAPPFAVPLLTNQPTLETMTKAALNVLGNNSKGFAVMIEGGAVDWANHSNQKGRMIEEQIDFNNAVRAVVTYLDANRNGNNWSNTLLIVTADHECGHLFGDGTGSFFDVNGNGKFDDGVDYGHVVDKGVGNPPGTRYYGGDHTNALVPLFVRGAGSELFAREVIGTDPNLRALYNLDASWTGQYVDNTAVYRVMRTSVP